MHKILLLSLFLIVGQPLYMQAASSLNEAYMIRREELIPKKHKKKCCITGQTMVRFPTRDPHIFKSCPIYELPMALQYEHDQLQGRKRVKYINYLLKIEFIAPESMTAAEKQVHKNIASLNQSDQPYRLF